MKATLHTDGGARGNPGPAGVGFVLKIPGRDPITHGQYIGQATNNQAEYIAITKGLRRALNEGVGELHCYVDSELVVRQLGGQYRVKNPGIRPLYEQVCALVAKFDRVRFSHIPREENKQADQLVNEAIDRAN